jgi:hypothetical protein
MPSAAVLGRIRNASHSSDWILTSASASFAICVRQIFERSLVEDWKLRNFGTASRA